LLSGAELFHVRACWTDAEEKRVPPLLEARVFDVNRKSGVVDLARPGRPQQFGKVSSTSTC
jgi:hypothetical protein